MKINSLSIVPEANIGCNAKCKYCISPMTKHIRDKIKKPGIILPKLEKCIKFCVNNGATTAIITSTGETLLGSWTTLENILWLCSKYFGRIDLHTNGQQILVQPSFGKDFSTMIAPYLTNITITVPHYFEEKQKEIMWQQQTINYQNLFYKLKNLGLTIRLSCVVCKEGICTEKDFQEYIKWAKKLEINEIIFRELWTPQNSDNNLTKWCKKNYISLNDIENNLLDPYVLSKNEPEPMNIYDKQPYNFNGIGVSYTTCTENNNIDEIKSAIYRPDNFLYADWDKNYKII